MKTISLFIAVLISTIAVAQKTVITRTTVTVLDRNGKIEKVDSSISTSTVLPEIKDSLIYRDTVIYRDTCLPSPEPNKPPVSNAGPDRSLQLPTSVMTITGTGTDPDGTVVSYVWSRVSGPNTPSLSGVNTNNLVASNLVQGVYTFRLTVVDDNGATASDDMNLTVVAAPIPSTGSIKGFGSEVTGGTGYPVRWVNSLSATALIDAIGTGNCIVKFSVSGTINGVRLERSNIKNLTIDGEGKITLNNGNNGDLFAFEPGCENIIIKGLKLRNAGNDLIGVRCSKVVITNNSFDKAGDGLCDITEGAQFVTVQYNLFGASTAGSILIAYDGVKNITIHNNIFTARDRAPLAHNATGTWPNNRSNPVSYLMAEVVNNAMTNYSDRASIASYGGTLQLKNNWYYNESGIKINADNRTQDNSSTMFCSGNVTATGKTIGINNHAEWVIPDKYMVPLRDAATNAKELKALVGSGNNDSRDIELLALLKL